MIYNKNNRLIIKGKNKISILPFSDILFIEKFNGETLINTSSKNVEINSSLAKLESELPDYFVRGHRSFIINSKKIFELISINKDNYEVSFLNSEKVAM